MSKTLQSFKVILYMSLVEIRRAFHNSNLNNEVTLKIQNLVQVVPRKIQKKKDFLHLLNIISCENKTQWLDIFSSFTDEWDEEYCDIFASILKSQSLYTDIYLELFLMLQQVDKDFFLKKILSMDVTPVETQTIGKFIGKLFGRLPNFEPLEVFKDITISPSTQAPSTQKLAVLAISAFLSMVSNGRKKHIPSSLYNSLKQIKLDTRTLMLLYDLEDQMV